MNKQKLPHAFADLEPFMDWALPTESLRLQKREESTIDVIREFYDAAQPKAAAALVNRPGSIQKRGQDQASRLNSRQPMIGRVSFPYNVEALAGCSRQALILI